MLSDETKQIIQRKVKLALESQRQMKRDGLRPQSLTMLIFDSQADYESFYAPEERLGEDYRYFNEAAEAVRRGLSAVAIPAESAIAHWADYLKWLAGRQHSAHTRTEYAAYLGAIKHIDPSKIKGPSYS
jgi:hypothetical protein